MPSQLEQLKACTAVVADSVGLRELAVYGPRDGAVHPARILEIAGQPEYARLVAQTVAAHRGQLTDAVVDRVLVRFGCAMLAIVPGRVATPVDARASFDAAATIARAQRIMALYAAEGIERERVLIEVVATWEGIQAAKALEHHGIHCGMTLVFGLAQAVACAEAGARLIAPLVGHIRAWHERTAGSGRDAAAHAGAADPGVQALVRIWRYYKKFGIDTEVMGADLRDIDQVRALAGCDVLSIAPALLNALQASDAPLERRLGADDGRHCDDHALSFNEASLRYALNEDAMVGECLAAGIRTLAADAARLDDWVRAS